jgi:hypothetical protein
MADLSTRAFEKIVNVEWNDSGSEVGNRYEMNVVFVHENSAALQMYLYLAAVYCAYGCGIVRLNGAAEAAERRKKFKVIGHYLKTNVI